MDDGNPIGATKRTQSGLDRVQGFRFQLTPPNESTRLVPATESDIGWLYHFASAYPERWPRVCELGTPSLPEFRSRVWSRTVGLLRVDAKVRDRDDIGRPIGFLGIYNLNPTSGVAWIERLDVRSVEREEMNSALTDIIQITRRSWALRRIFFEYYDCVPSPIGHLESITSHGRLHDYGYFLGGHCDLVIESVDL